MRIGELKKYDLIYMGTPYTAYPYGREIAAIHAGKVAARLLSEGFNIFAPIPYGHSIEATGKLKANDLTIWGRLNAAMLRKCDALLVVMLVRWQESIGLMEEIKTTIASNKPILYLNPMDFSLSVAPC